MIRHKKIDHIKKNILKKSKSYEQKSNGIDKMIEQDFKYFNFVKSQEQMDLNEIQDQVKKVEALLKSRQLKMKKQALYTQSIKLTALSDNNII